MPHFDDVCPPSTVFSAFNHYDITDKAIRVWPYNGHEGGGQHQVAEQLRWLRSRVSRFDSDGQHGGRLDRQAGLEGAVGR